MSLASERGQRENEMDGWSEDHRRWDKEWERANACMFGCNCRHQLNCAFLHSPEELQLFKDEKELRMRKLRMRCGFCVRGECRFGACCARSRRCAAEQVAEDSEYESSGASAEDDSSADSAGEGSALAGGSDSGEDEGWLTQGSAGAASSMGDYWSGDDGCSDGGRFAALWVEDERHEEKIVRGVGLLGGGADLRFDGGKTRRDSERAAEEKAAAAAAAAQEEAALAAALAAAQGEAACEPEARGRGQTAGARDRARAGWDRVRVAVSELPWRRFRRVFRRKRRVAVEGPVLTVERVGTVLWMAWERARDGWRREREETAEQTAAELAVRLQERVQRRQQVGYSGWEAAREYSSEGYCSGDSSDADRTIGSLLAAQTPERAEVVAAAMREWDRQHEWLH